MNEPFVINNIKKGLSHADTVVTARFAELVFEIVNQNEEFL